MQEKVMQENIMKPDKMKTVNNTSAGLSPAKNAALISIMATILIVGKYGLAIIPYNVEVVTSLVLIFACVFSFRAVGATLIFCVADMILYQFSIDVVISYFIYWDALAIAAALLSRAGVRWWVAYLVLGLCFTLSFGFLTTFFYWLLIDDVSYLAKYAVGLPFYAGQMLSVLGFMSVGFKPLTKELQRIKRQYYGG